MVQYHLLHLECGQRGRKAGEETSMELGMGMESGPLHSCQVLIRERSETDQEQ